MTDGPAVAGPMSIRPGPPPFRYVTARQLEVGRRNLALPPVPNRNIDADEARVLGFLALHRYMHPPTR